MIIAENMARAIAMVTDLPNRLMLGLSCPPPEIEVSPSNLLSDRQHDAAPLAQADASNRV